MVRNVKGYKITEKQKRFCEEYLKDLNGTQSAIRAGYSKRSANEQAARLLAKDNVNEYLNKLRQKIEDDNKLTIQWVLDELVKNKERAMQEEPVYDKEGNETGEYTYQGAVANKAIELIGKHLGMWQNKLELSGNVGVTIINDMEKEK